MSPVELEERTEDLSSEEVQNTDIPQYRITFGTFVIRVPDPSLGE